MKKFGLPLLLSAGYAGILLLIFSSDFSKEHSFLLRAPLPTHTAMGLGRPSETREDFFSERIASLREKDLQASEGESPKIRQNEQSPESAATTGN